MKTVQGKETTKQIRETYKALRVGRYLYCESRYGQQRVIGAGTKLIRLMNGKSITGADVIDWWVA